MLCLQFFTLVHAPVTPQDASMNALRIIGSRRPLGGTRYAQASLAQRLRSETRSGHNPELA